MAPFSTGLALAGAVLGGAMLLLWLLSLRLRDASIVDPFWGSAFVLATWTAFLGAGAPGPRAALALALVTLWGLRLTGHLLLRRRGHGEDFRYAAMRRAHGERFWWVSLLTVFLLQGLLAWVIALPLQAAVLLPQPDGPGALEAFAALLFAGGFLLEAVADAQLARFKADPASRGRALDTGVWRFSRHPNYFGDAVQWWAFGLLGAAAGAPWTLLSPALMTFLLLRVSGVRLLEKDIAERRPAYRAYARRTSAFVPWFPRASSADGAAEGR